MAEVTEDDMTAGQIVYSTICDDSSFWTFLNPDDVANHVEPMAVIEASSDQPAPKPRFWGVPLKTQAQLVAETDGDDKRPFYGTQLIGLFNQGERFFTTKQEAIDASLEEMNAYYTEHLNAFRAFHDLTIPGDN